MNSTSPGPISPSHVASGPSPARLRLPGGLEITPTQVVLIAVIVLFALATPGDFAYKLDVLGFGVCHEIPSHSFIIGGHQMPLCARCSGIYLGALSALVLLAVLRRRSSRLPTWQMVIVFGVFFGAMVLDGVNSTLESFGSGMWDSTNLVRILTGSLAGVSVAFIFYPVFNMSLWHREVAEGRKRVMERPIELVGYMLAAGLLVALVLDGHDWLFYPLSFLSILGMVTLLSMANIILVLIFARREATARTFSQALTPILIGVLLTLVELTLFAWGRASLAPYLAGSNLGFPLTPGLP